MPNAKQSKRKVRNPEDETEVVQLEAQRVETLILGAGPAGLQLSYALTRDGRDHLILEAAERAGSFFEHYPRHRKLLSINKRYTGYDDPEVNMRWDWNSLIDDEHSLLFRDYSERYFPDADDLARYCRDFAEHHQLPVRYRTRADRVERAPGGGFQVTTSRGTVYHAARLVVATGVSKLNVPDIPGVELAERYDDVSVDPDDFIDQRVLIVGKGNSAFETADNLVETASLLHLASPHSIQLAWQSHFVGHIRAVNNNMLDTYQLKSQNALLDATVERIERDDDDRLAVTVRYSHACGEVETLTYDRVILCTGFRFDTSIFAADVRPETVIDGRFPAQTAEWESVNVPDLYFGGVLMQARDYKKTTSAFIHGFRYNMLALARIFEGKYHGNPWPCRDLGARTPGNVTQALLERINRSSALWQQFGYIADVISVGADGRARYFEEVPVDLIDEGGFGDHPEHYRLTLEYGPHHAKMNPFAAERVARDDVDNADASNFLHPVVRHYRNGEMLAEHHVIEDLLAEWWEDEHVEPLRAWLTETMSGGAEAEAEVA
ncbi:MAG TPA: NAD(P)-binding domain-containing protein [Thermoanaerobaculia bacterium]|nr:NAD(P)-binding domain-containing protein [Thermoanaerobaculia bacterium]